MVKYCNKSNWSKKVYFRLTVQDGVHCGKEVTVAGAQGTWSLCICSQETEWWIPCPWNSTTQNRQNFWLQWRQSRTVPPPIMPMYYQFPKSGSGWTQTQHTVSTDDKWGRQTQICFSAPSPGRKMARQYSSAYWMEIHAWLMELGSA